MEKGNLLKLSNSNNEYKIVYSSVASIYNKPTFTSELITQALIWEELLICNKKNNWYKVKQRDGYIGWIHSFYIVDSGIYENNKELQNRNNWYWIKDKSVELLLKDNSIFEISFGSLIPCFKNKSTFFTILPNNEKVNISHDSLMSFDDIIIILLNNYSEKNNGQ